MSRRNKKRVDKNVTVIYIVINSEKENMKVTLTQKLAFISALIGLISAIISLIIKLM